MYINEPEVPKEVIDKICCTCYQRIGSGIRHPCSKREIVQNIKILLMSTDKSLIIAFCKPKFLCNPKIYFQIFRFKNS